MAIVEQTDQVEQAVALLLQQYQGKAKIEALLSSYVTPIQELEGVIFDVLVGLQVDTAIGEQLDVIGRVVNLRRSGLGDEEYRGRLKAQILVNRSNGTPEQLIQIARLIVPDDTGLLFEETYPGQFTLEATDDLDSYEQGEAAARAINSARPAGVYFYFVFGTVDEEAFTFSATDATVTDATYGFGDDGGGSTGGVFATAHAGGA